MGSRMERVCIFAVVVASLLVSPVDGGGSSNLRREVMVKAAEKRRPEDGKNGWELSTARGERFCCDGSARRGARDGMLRGVDGGWEVAMDTKFSEFGHGFCFEDAFAAENNDFEVATELDNNPCENALFDRVNGILIPQVRFIDTPLNAVIASLANMAEKNDSVENGGGINVVLLGQRGADEPKVTLSLKNISLYRLMELVAKSAGYCFDLAEDAAIFYQRDMVGEIIETRFFPVSRATVIRLTGAQEMEYGGNGNSDSTENIARCERGIMEFFQRAGVDFKGISGSNLAFDGSQIIVTNTGGNLRKQQFTKISQ